MVEVPFLTALCQLRHRCRKEAAKACIITARESDKFSLPSGEHPKDLELSSGIGRPTLNPKTLNPMTSASLPSCTG